MVFEPASDIHFNLACPFRSRPAATSKSFMEGGLRTRGIERTGGIFAPPGDSHSSLISIVTVVFNDKSRLEKTIQSVLEKANPYIEYIIIDGGSKDGTLDVIRHYESHIDYWISEPDGGIFDAMNKGTRLCSGRWVNFMNAGDLLRSSLQEIQRFSPSDHCLLYGYSTLTAGKGTFVNKAKVRPGNPFTMETDICHQAMFYNREEILEFDLRYPVAADRVMNSILTRNSSKKIGFIDEIICEYDLRGNSSSHPIQAVRERFLFAWEQRDPRAMLLAIARAPLILIYPFVLNSTLYYLYARRNE
jgi:glycosyltransferase involved in cell wall biosynthesis